MPKSWVVTCISLNNKYSSIIITPSQHITLTPHLIISLTPHTSSPLLLTPHHHPHSSHFIITLTSHTSLLQNRMVVYTPSTPPPLATLMQSMQPTRHGHWRQTISSPTLMDHMPTGLATSPVDLLSKGMFKCVTTSFKPANSWRPLEMACKQYPQESYVSSYHGDFDIHYMLWNRVEVKTLEHALVYTV